MLLLLTCSNYFMVRYAFGCRPPFTALQRHNAPAVIDRGRALRVSISLGVHLPLQARDDDGDCRDVVVWPRNTDSGCWYTVNEVLDVSTMQPIVLKFVTQMLSHIMLEI